MNKVAATSLGESGDTEPQTCDFSQHQLIRLLVEVGKRGKGKGERFGIFPLTTRNFLMPNAHCPIFKLGLL
ncbi:hypothetical protein VF07_25150 [Nostoc linckia z6]|uniref:Uncharacterized protein n=1 Tax=Nostoc linckia z8 TaxID=1628746 RepID=A0A9Q6EIE2_NOSLI|nr:hypothetical protein VF05_25840 [Nostoc linckia z3]PHJ70382.1 hypothetical protein VF03_22075 [Nostoc linckia z2]PHJ84468.1 hypothetical protein VF07_25150 [Nostoc linckia z6]PHJ97136.1 hypothetical protein VF08_29180 [Nostoc linckia z8]